MSGGAYYKSLRAHIFADAAFCSYVLRQYSSQDELKEMEQFITRCKEEKLGSII